MRRFSYAWKSSDGVRHVDEMAARTKEDVFASLRTQGIRAISVAEIVPRWRQFARAAVAAAAAGVVLASVLVAIRAQGGRDAGREEEVSAEDERTIGRFADETRTIAADFESQAGAVRANDPRRIQKLRTIIDFTRSRLRFTYRELGDFGSAAARSRVALLYGRVNALIDDREFELDEVE